MSKEISPEDKELLARLELNPDAFDEEIDTIGSVPLRKIIEICLEGS